MSKDTFGPSAPDLLFHVMCKLMWRRVLEV